jgi:biotin transport system substrate-specific component
MQQSMSFVNQIFISENKYYNMIKNIASILVANCLLVLSAHTKIVMYPINTTMQTFALLSLSTLLGRKLALITVMLYLSEILIGFPFSTTNLAGPAVFMGPTGGFLIGFVVAAYFAGKCGDEAQDRYGAKCFGKIFFAHIMIYVFGILWLSKLYGLSLALKYGVYPYIFTFIIKNILVSLTVNGLWKIKNIR